MLEGKISTTVIEEIITSYWIYLPIKYIRMHKLMRGQCVRVALTYSGLEKVFIRPLARRHYSLSITVPMYLAKKLGMSRGDLVWFDLIPLEHVDQQGQTITVPCDSDSHEDDDDE